MKGKLLTISLSVLLICSIATAASAATNILIGKKVQKTMNVEVDGKKIKDAIVVDNTTYVPVRSFSEAAGYNLKLEGDDVKLSIEAAEKELVDKIKADNQIDILKGSIQGWQSEVAANKETVKQAEKSIADVKAYNEKAGNDAPKLDSSGAEDKLKRAQEAITELESKIKDAEAEIKALEK
ncbi:hypothetical protein D3C77_434110 [compost metagenome]